MKQFCLLLLSLLLQQTVNLAQSFQVWPGDANNNGRVSNVDFLHIGMAYNNFGPARDSIASTWEAQSGTAWPQVLGNGVNVGYIDANGDGLVNYFYDAFPVYVHYGLTHGVETPDIFPVGLPGIDPPLFLDEAALPQNVYGGSVLNLPLVLGTADLPIDHLYGIAFSLHVDPQFVDVDQISLLFNQFSWANPDNDRIHATYRASDSRLDVAWVRTDHNERSGHGPIGTVSIIIIDDVISLEQSFNIRIDSIQLLDRFGNKTTTAGDTLTITILPDNVTADAEPGPDRFSIWPNPARDVVYLHAATPIRAAVLYDAWGRPVDRIEPGTNQATWPVSGLPSGVYWIEVQTGGRFMRQRLLIN